VKLLDCVSVDILGLHALMQLPASSVQCSLAYDVVYIDTS
jgi:hypothetical protein